MDLRYLIGKLLLHLIYIWKCLYIICFIIKPHIYLNYLKCVLNISFHYQTDIPVSHQIKIKYTRHKFNIKEYVQAIHKKNLKTTMIVLISIHYDEINSVAFNDEYSVLFAKRVFNTFST